MSQIESTALAGLPGSTTTPGAEARPAQRSTGLGSIGKTEFLKLLVAQLQHQDPLSPMKNEEFVAQLATFSSLEQLISINEGVSKLSTLADQGKQPELR